MDSRTARLILALAWTLGAAASRADTPLCCGRGLMPVGPRSPVSLERRGSPWAGDVVLALEPAAPGAPAAVRLEGALAAVPGVARAEVEPVRPVARVWLADPARAPVPELCRAAREAGRPAIPALLTRVAFGGAGEKQRVERAGRALASLRGIVGLEVEAEGESGVARVWHRPELGAGRLVAALATSGIEATVLR